MGRYESAVRNTPRPGRRYEITEKLPTTVTDARHEAFAKAFEVGNVISFRRPSVSSTNLEIIVHWGEHSLHLVEVPRSDVYRMFAVGEGDWAGEGDDTLYRLAPRG